DDESVTAVFLGVVHVHRCDSCGRVKRCARLLPRRAERAFVRERVAARQEGAEVLRRTDRRRPRSRSGDATLTALATHPRCRSPCAWTSSTIDRAPAVRGALRSTSSPST